MVQPLLAGTFITIKLQVGKPVLGRSPPFWPSRKCIFDAILIVLGHAHTCKHSHTHTKHTKHKHAQHDKARHFGFVEQILEQTLRLGRFCAGAGAALCVSLFTLFLTSLSSTPPLTVPENLLLCLFLCVQCELFRRESQGPSKLKDEAISALRGKTGKCLGATH